MPRPKKQTTKQEVKKTKTNVTDYESDLIQKQYKFRRLIDFVSRPEWDEIVELHKKAAESLDMSWAYADPQDPKFKQMQVAKLATMNFISLKPALEHDLDLVNKQLTEFQHPESIIKKDFDEEGITEPPSKTENTAYHG